MHYPGICAWKLDWDDYFINIPSERRIHSCLFNYSTNLMFISEDKLLKFAFTINCKDPLNQIVGTSKPFKTFSCTASTLDFLGFKMTVAEIEFKKMDWAVYMHSMWLVTIDWSRQPLGKEWWSWAMVMKIIYQIWVSCILENTHSFQILIYVLLFSRWELLEQCIQSMTLYLWRESKKGHAVFYAPMCHLRRYKACVFLAHLLAGRVR